jgi:hypothetical protein
MLLFALFWTDFSATRRAAHLHPSLSPTVRADRVTARIRRVPLRVVLEELALHSALRLSVNGRWADYPVTADFLALPPDEALQRLLSGLSYAIIYEAAPELLPGDAAAKRVGELLVFENARKAPSALRGSERAKPLR